VKVLLVEGGQAYAAWLGTKLLDAGFSPVSMVATPGLFRSEIARQVVATIIDADREGQIPGQIVRRARDAGYDAPLLVISGREDWREKVDAFDAGADDYLVKPIRSEEIAARLRALVRRAAGQTSDLIAVGPLAINLKARTACLAGHGLNLTRNEFRLLRHLLMWPESIHTSDDIRGLIQQAGNCGSSNAVEVLVARLRRKIGKDAIRTIRGVGYRLADELHCELAHQKIVLADQLQVAG
jgi:two-component system, OmpR family, response regulator